MVQKEFTLSEDFEIAGDWWLPESNKRVPGVLRSTPRLMKLHLDGLLGNLERRFRLLDGQFVVFGIDEAGQKWSLLKCFECNISPTMIPGTSKREKSEVVVNIMVRGAHVNSLDELEVDSVYVSLFGLESSLALANSGVSLEEWKADHLSISWSPPPGFQIRINSWNVALRTQFWPQTSLHLEEASIKHRARLVLEFDSKRIYSEISTLIFGLSNLLTVLHGISTPLLSVVPYDRDTKQEIRVFFRQHSDPSPTPEPPSVSDLLLPLTAFTEEQLTRLVNTWFDLSESMELAINWFCALVKNPMPYKQIEYVNLVQSLESLHRSLMGDKYISDKEYKPIAKILRKSIPADLPTKISENLNALLSNGHRMSQSSRLRQIYEYLPVELRSAVIPDLDTFTSKVVKTRNFLTHLDKSAESKSMTAYQLPFANAGLQILFQLMVFQLLEIPVEAIRLRLPRFRVYQTFRMSIPWMPPAQEMHGPVSEAAYYSWLNRGCPIGDDWHDWFQAEKLLQVQN